MKCGSCGGELAGAVPVCPFCGSREDTDLRAVNSRSLGPSEAMPCPRCDHALEIWRLETEGATRDLDVERCPECSGIFFNPGELEAFLHGEVASTIWLDWDRMEALRAPTGEGPTLRDRHYVRCPICRELMNSRNFGRRSGVLVDICRAHGVWLDGGELRTIAEWWHAGGRHIHQANETERARDVIRPIQPVPIPKRLIEMEKDVNSSIPAFTLGTLLRAIAVFFGR